MKMVRFYMTSFIPCHFKEGVFDGKVHSLYVDKQMTDEEFKDLKEGKVMRSYCCGGCLGHEVDWDMLS